MKKVTLMILCFFAARAEASLPYLVRYKQPDKIVGATRPKLMQSMVSYTDELQTRVFRNSSLAVTPLWIANGSLVLMTPQQAVEIAKNENVLSVTPLGRRATINAANAPYVYGLKKIKVPEVFEQDPNLTGAGVKIGVIDTGIDDKHPDLIGKVSGFKDFTGNSKSTPYDDHGHGTHVSGTIAARRGASKIIGIAPEANLVVAKAFSKYGGTTDEVLLKSLQWMADPDGNPQTADQPKVINNSWNLDDADYSDMNPEDEPFCIAIKNLNALGVSVVFAAGNDGPSEGSIKTPASCPEAISVGATNSSDQIASFSSRGPVRWKSVTFSKPDISAPGVDIESASTSRGYAYKSGTSMAAPHVVGALALLYQLENGLTPLAAKNILMTGADDLGQKGVDDNYGAGRLNVLTSTHLLKQKQIRPGKVIGNDDFIEVEGDASNIPVEFRGLVDAIGWTNYGCTVAHLGNGFALSAGHCFDAKPTLEENLSCSYVHVKWGYRKNRSPYMESDCDKIVARMNSGPIDFTLLKLKTYPSVFIPPNLAEKIAPRSTITIFSHPSGRPLNWSQFCSVESFAHPPTPASFIQYACDTEGGSSGAPLIDPSSLSIIGIHAGGEPNMNYGTHIVGSPLEQILIHVGFKK